MISLAHHVGKKVVVQLKDQNAWIAVYSEGGSPSIVAMKDANGNASIVSSRFLIGDVVEKNGGYAIEIRDQNRNKLHVFLNPDAILSVTLVIDEPLIAVS